MYICVSNRQKSGKAECCGLAARRNRPTVRGTPVEFVCLPSQGGQSDLDRVVRVILVSAIKREPCAPTGYLSRRISPFSSKCNFPGP